jgi:hypothetical protein
MKITSRWSRVPHPFRVLCERVGDGAARVPQVSGFLRDLGVASTHSSPLHRRRVLALIGKATASRARPERSRRVRNYQIVIPSGGCGFACESPSAVEGSEVFSSPHNWRVPANHHPESRACPFLPKPRADPRGKSYSRRQAQRPPRWKSA